LTKIVQSWKLAYLKQNVIHNYQKSSEKVLFGNFFTAKNLKWPPKTLEMALFRQNISIFTKED